MQPPSEQITELLQSWSQGDQGAIEKLVPLVYDELHRLAQALHVRRTAGAHPANHSPGKRGVPAAGGFLARELGRPRPISSAFARR